MRASTGILASFVAGLCAAQGVIRPSDYDIYNDPVHDQWFNLSTPLAKRQDQRISFRVASNILLISGYTYTYGAGQVGEMVDACVEHQGGETQTKGTCVKNAMTVASGYAIVGVLGYTGDTACVALLQKALGLANTLNGDQGQGPNSRRAAVSGSPPPAFTYGSPDIPDSTVDMMNHAIAVNQQQRAGATPDEEAPKVAAAAEQSCTNRNSNLYTSGHYWTFDDEYGMKLQCKNGCGNTDYDSQDMTNVIGSMVAAVYTSNDLNAQFTVYDKNSGSVFARCKLTFESTVTDTCPEGIDGHGCNF